MMFFIVLSGVAPPLSPWLKTAVDATLVASRDIHHVALSDARRSGTEVGVGDQS